jgi:hypothetical protein
MMMSMRAWLFGLGLVFGNSAAWAAGELPFHCTVKNVVMLKSGITPKQVCDAMKVSAERSLRVRMKPEPQFGLADRGRWSWVKIDVTLHPSGEAIATVVRRKAGRQRSFPPIAVSVSDKRMDMQSIKQLAEEVGNALAR